MTEQPQNPAKEKAPLRDVYDPDAPYIGRDISDRDPKEVKGCLCATAFLTVATAVLIVAASSGAIKLAFRPF